MLRAKVVFEVVFVSVEILSIRAFIDLSELCALMHEANSVVSRLTPHCTKRVCWGANGPCPRLAISSLTFVVSPSAVAT